MYILTDILSKLDNTLKRAGKGVSRHPKSSPYGNTNHMLRKVVYKGDCHIYTLKIPSINTFPYVIVIVQNDASMYYWTNLFNSLYNTSDVYKIAILDGMEKTGEKKP